jgi:hypothetical protein
MTEESFTALIALKSKIEHCTQQFLVLNERLDHQVLRVPSSTHKELRDMHAHRFIQPQIHLNKGQDKQGEDKTERQCNIEDKHKEIRPAYLVVLTTNYGSHEEQPPMKTPSQTPGRKEEHQYQH